MRFAILPNKPGTVYRKHNGKALQANVMKDFVICALQESGIDRNDRPGPRCRHAGSHSNRMFFSNANVKKAIREFRCKAVKPRSLRHRGRYGDNSGIRTRKSAQRPRKYGRIAFPLISVHRTRIYIKFSNSMEFLRILLRKCISFSFFGDGMNHNRTVKLLCPSQHLRKRHKVMSIHRAKISKSHFLKQNVWNEKILDPVFEAQCISEQPNAHFRKPLQELCGVVLKPLVRAAGAHAV